MKKPIWMALTAVMICMLQVMILPAIAQYACGLQSGNYAKYNWSISASEAGQSYSISGTLDVSINSVSGSSYSGTFKETVTGGSLPTGLLDIPQTNQTFSGDVGSGYGTTGFINVFAIPANMTANGNIPGVGSVQQIGSWGGRSAVIVNSSALGLGQGNSYFDQKTGIFLSATTTFGYQGLYSLEYKLDMIGTNLWSGGFGTGSLGIDPVIWAVIIIIIVVAVAAAAIMIRRKKPPATPAQTSIQPPPPPPPPA